MEREELKAIIEEAIEKNFKIFYVEREQHYQDHLFISELREFVVNIKSTVLKTIVKICITALMGLLLLGFILWLRMHK